MNNKEKRILDCVDETVNYCFKKRGEIPLGNFKIKEVIKWKLDIENLI